jgi:cytochrome d ubiquinol oxidase subunit I
MGYGLLVKRYVNDLSRATGEMMDKAAMDSVPKVAPLFWSFRIMVGLGFAMLALFAVAFWSSLKNNFQSKRWLQKWALYFIPMPWIAAQAGWIVAEYGRQPWTVFGLLPTHLSVSSVSASSVIGSIAGFIIFYTLLLIAELYLMFKYARLGPTVLEPSKA